MTLRRALTVLLLAAGPLIALTACGTAGAAPNGLALTTSYPTGYQFGTTLAGSGQAVTDPTEAAKACVQADQQRATSEGLPYNYSRNDGWLAGCVDGLTGAPQSPRTDPPIPDTPTNGAQQ